MMTLNVADRDKIDRRRVLVSTALLTRRSVRQIKEHLAGQGIEVSVGTVHSDIQAIRARWRALAQESFDQMVAEERAKFDALEGKLMANALAGDLPAVDRVLEISKQRRQLFGLNAPTRVETKVTLAEETLLDVEIRQLLEAMQSRDAAPI